MSKKRNWLAVITAVFFLIANSANVSALTTTTTSTTTQLSAPTMSYYPMSPTNKDVTVTVYYPSIAKVKQYKLGLNGIWTTYYGPVTLSSNVYFLARYQDSLGVWSPLGGVTVTNIDKTPPANPTFTSSIMETTNQDVAVTVGYSSDSTTKQYKIGSDGVWENYTAPVILNSNNTIYAKACDNAGNWTADASCTVENIDKTPPEAPVITASTFEKTCRPVTISINYSQDSILKQYKIGLGGNWTDYSAPFIVNSNNAIYAKSFDAAGNPSLEIIYQVTNIVPLKTVLGYTVKNYSTDVSSYNSIIANTDVLNEIATATYSVDGYGTLTGTAPTDQINYANSNGITTKLMVGNNFDANIAKQLLESPSNRQNLKNNIINLLRTYSYKGVDIDLENIPASQRSNFTSFMSEIYTSLKPLGYDVSVAVVPKTYDSSAAPWTYAFDYQSLAMYSDYLMIMAYDEHYPGGTPGAVASINWVSSIINYALTVVPKEKIVLGLAAYGYDWSTSPTRAYSINSCYSIANQYGASINFDNVTKSKYFTYTANGVEHTLWFEDADTIGYKLDIANSMDLKGIGIWRLGLENSNYWNMIKSKINK